MNQHLKLAYDQGVQKALIDAGLIKTAANPVVNHIRSTLGLDVSKARKALDEMEAFDPIGPRPKGKVEAAKFDEDLAGTIKYLSQQKQLHEANYPLGMNARSQLFDVDKGGVYLDRLRALQTALQDSERVRRNNLVGLAATGGIGALAAPAIAMQSDQGLLNAGSLDGLKRALGS